MPAIIAISRAMMGRANIAFIFFVYISAHSTMNTSTINATVMCFSSFYWCLIEKFGGGAPRTKTAALQRRADRVLRAKINGAKPFGFCIQCHSPGKLFRAGQMDADVCAAAWAEKALCLFHLSFAPAGYPYFL